MKDIKRVAFLTPGDPMDKRAWSGIPFRMLEALKYEFDEVIPLGPINCLFIEFLLKAFQFIILKITGKRYNRGHTIILSKAHAYIIDRKLRRDNFDIIFAPSASISIAYLKTKIPIYYFADATVHAMIDYYDSFSNLSEFSIKESNHIEKKAIHKSQMSIFASYWAANDALKFYKSIPKHTMVIKMGANIEKAPVHINLEHKLSQKECNLLFLGVDWKRKGGEIAYKTFELLIEKGFNANLVVCGCIPPYKHPNMKVYPFLNKNLEKDNRIFTQLLEEAHFLLLPTRAECAGIVFCEAAAHGIPVITTDTGGVSSYVKNGINGYILPLDAHYEKYANTIINTFHNKELYSQLSIQSRKLYFNDLNWTIWAKKIKVLICSPTS